MAPAAGRATDILHYSLPDVSALVHFIFSAVHLRYQRRPFLTSCHCKYVVQTYK